MRKLAWSIYQQRTSVISTIFNGQKLHFKNEDGVLYYITEGIKKLDKVVNQIDLPSNSVILDAGGNTGLFSLLLKTRFPDAEIYIIEPGEELIPIIEKNLEGQTKIKIIKKALSAKSGKALFYINPGAQQTNSLQKDAVSPFISTGHELVATEVDCINLSDLRKEYNLSKINLMKIDIQGSEYPVLKDSQEHMQDIDNLLAEVSFLTEDNVLLCTLLSANYPLYKILGEVKMGADILFYKKKH